MSIINNKYELIEKIGSGSFGSIYKGKNKRTNEYVAIKVEPLNDINVTLLKNESIIYQHLKDCKCIPSVKWFGKDNINYYMVINLLGNSLQTYMDHGKKFSLALTLKIGIKLLEILKTIHDKGLVHRDIKPHNFLFGKNDPNNLYLIDFGFCKTYMQNGKHIPFKQTAGLIGSKNYASILSHKHCELSRRDDLESTAYILLYLCSGYLPWAMSSDEMEIIELKHNIVKNENKKYPTIILDTLKYIRSMKFEENPNYYYIIDNFKKEIELLSKNS